MSVVGSRGCRRSVPYPIGVSVNRLDGVDKVTGMARYTGDLVFANAAHAVVVRCPYPRARIVGYNTTAASTMTGVLAVVTGNDPAVVGRRFGQLKSDQPLLADHIATYAGEPVVAVVAEDEAIARRAAGMVTADYEPLPYVIDARDALKPDAPTVHGPEPGPDPATDGVRHHQVHGNVCAQVDHAWGDIDLAFRGADHIASGTYSVPMAFPCALEPYVALADVNASGITVWTATQHPFIVRRDLARCFDQPLSRVRVLTSYVGGGFGGKSFTKIEPLACALSLAVRRPVRLALSIDESILTSRSDSAEITLETAFDRDGTMRGRRGSIVLNTGAYAGTSPAIARAAALRLAGPYRLAAVSIRSTCVYTNTVPAASFRGFGAPHAAWASEQQVDEAAQALGLDPVAIRLRNVLRRGERIAPGARPLDGDLAANLRRLVSTTPRPQPRAGRRRTHGIGYAISASDAGYLPTSSAIVRVHTDSSVTIASGSTELGQRSETILAQVVAAELQVPIENVRVVQGDTGLAPFETSTGASRTTTVVGLAVQRASLDARRRLRRIAARTHAVPLMSVVVRPGGAMVGGEFVAWGDIVREWLGGTDGEVVGYGSVRGTGRLRERPLFWELACAAARVSMDADSGRIRVDQLTIVGDVGRAINPQMAEGQDRGAATMGLGLALLEELVFQDGALVTLGLADYRIPRFSDIPEFRTVLVERADGPGPFGARGNGEGAVGVASAAIANAVADLTGVRFRGGPLTPSRVHLLASAASAPPTRRPAVPR
jgi:CO/xanthine dehydrogenase Mo-binding subunit